LDINTDTTPSSALDFSTAPIALQAFRGPHQPSCFLQASRNNPDGEVSNYTWAIAEAAFAADWEASVHSGWHRSGDDVDLYRPGDSLDRHTSVEQ
jgi:hypothetical protein